MARRYPYAPLVIAIFLVAGATLRILQVAWNASLWGDELAVVLSVTERGWGEMLTSPLANEQVAPVGFLIAVKFGTLLLGETEMGLRLYPLLASIAALVLFWRFALRYLEGAPLVGAVALFALSPALLWYARNAKQYSGDVAVVLVLLLLALRSREHPLTMRSGAAIGLLGGVAILFSQPAGMVALALIPILLAERRRRGEPLAPLAPLAGGWIGGTGLMVATSLVLVPPNTRDSMSDGWRFAFFPPPWGGWGDFFWLPERFLAFFGFLVGLFKPDSAPEVLVAAVYLALAILGLVRLGRTRSSATAILLAPVAAAIMASIFRILPLSGRVAIYMLPPLVVLSLTGVAFLRDRLAARHRPWSAAAAILLGIAPAPLLPLLLPEIGHRRPARQVLEEVGARWQPGDLIYVNPSGRSAIEFYGPRNGIREWTVGERQAGGPAARVKQVDRLRGRPRVWFFFTGAGRCEPQVFRTYLSRIGTEKVWIPDPYGNVGGNEATASLFALDDPARWSAASPGSREVEPEDCRTPRQGTRIWQRLREIVGRDSE